MADLELRLIDQPKPEDTEPIRRGLHRHNVAVTNDDSQRWFAILARDGDRTIGGAIASVAWGWGYLDVLWVSEDCRGRGIGQELLAAVEREASARGARNIFLFTFSFQAPQFYLKRGYTIFGQLEDYPPPHTKYYLRKILPGCDGASAQPACSTEAMPGAPST